MRNRILIIIALFVSVLSYADNMENTELSQAPADSLVVNSIKGKVIKMQGSFLKPLQKRDSILIADQLDYGFIIKNITKGTNFQLPDLKKALDSIDLVRTWKLDTLKVYKEGKDRPEKYDISASVRITSFKPGNFQLPVLSAVMPDKGSVDTLVFPPLKMKVCTIAVDTAKFKVHDIKGQILYPITFKEVLPYILAVLVVILLICLIVYLIIRYRRRSGIAKKILEPPHIIALRELEKYRGNKYWVAEKQKLFYSGVTDAIREYMSSRYGFRAMEMTTAEIFAELKHFELPDSLYQDAKSLFETSDYVKFAKMTVSDEENSKAVPTAVRFVTETYQSEIDKEAEQSANELKTK